MASIGTGEETVSRSLPSLPSRCERPRAGLRRAWSGRPAEAAVTVLLIDECESGARADRVPADASPSS
jgi:hypothetical protein